MRTSKVEIAKIVGIAAHSNSMFMEFLVHAMHQQYRWGKKKPTSINEVPTVLKFTFSGKRQITSKFI